MAQTDNVSHKRAKLEYCQPGHDGRDFALTNLADALLDRFQEEGRIEDMNEAIELHRAALELRPSGHPDRYSSHNLLAFLLVDRYDRFGVVADLDEAIILGRAALELCPPGHSDHSTHLHNLGCYLEERFQKLTQMHDLDEAIELHRAALELHPPGHPHRLSSLFWLGLCFSNKYDHQGAIAELDETIMLSRASLELRPPGSHDRGVSLHSLAGYLQERFQKLATICDLEEAIELHRAALELHPPGHPHHSSSLHSLALCLSDRYDHQGAVADLDEAIIGRAALELRPAGHSCRLLSLQLLARCFSNKYDHRGSVADLDEAIMLGHAELELCPPEHPSRDISLYNLGRRVWKRFQKLAAVCDLEEAIKWHRAALEIRPLGHPHRLSSLQSLACCFSFKYDDQGAVADLDEAITLGRAALELCPPGHPDHGIQLHNLGCYLQERFQKLAAMHYLDEAIELHRAALKLHSHGHPHRSSSLHSLSLCLSDRYDHQGAVADLDEAIVLSRAALELRPPGHPNRGISLYNLGRRLWKRFRKLAAMRDLEEAIGLHRTALELHPPGHPNRSSSLHSLSLCLSDKYDHQGVVAHLEEAIILRRAELELCPEGHPNRDISLHNLGRCIWQRLQKLATMCDLEEAIDLHRAALELRPLGNPHRLSSLCPLALCFSKKYDCKGMVADLDEAITFSRAALKLCPLGHPKRDLSLSNLTCNLWTRYQSTVPKSGKAKFLRQAALAPHPTRPSDVATSLHTLSMCLWNRFQKQATMADLDETICLATYVLELRLPGHLDYAVSLEKLTLFIEERLANGTNLGESIMLSRAADNPCALSRYLKDRFRKQHSIINLNAAIALYRHVLQLRLVVHPGYPSNLHELALCLIDRFHQTATVDDLNNAITLEQKALQLSAPGDQDYNVRKDTLANCLQTKIRSPLPSSSRSVHSVVAEHEVIQAIHNIISETLETMPIRLLNTQTGTLCDRAAQLSHFVCGRQYNELLSSATSYNPARRIDRIRTAVAAHFQFVMFSHRWGEGEPSLRDIQGHPIYDMSPRGGVKKLQRFCAAALKQGYLWAWSDTCCIDKDSSAELQEAIGAMSGWYRRSALTIVYLADVRESGSFSTSQWFGRGWTLQELLAPRTVLLYTRNWTLYKNLKSLNHKTDGAVLEELEGSTGIASRFLTNFSPGMDDARSRLQWASSRRTTRPEDVAYSLFGIFNVNLPVIYGESAENALGRLLAEIISRSGDISILDWAGEASPFHSCFPAHITSYRALPLPPFSPEGQSSIVTSQSTQTEALRKFYGSLTKSPLPRFINCRLILPCLSYRINAVRLRSADASAPNYTYEIQASGLRPLEVTLPGELGNRTMSPDAFQLVRPWHSKLLGGSTKLDATAAEQLLITLGRPFNALLLAELPHNEYKGSHLLFSLLLSP